MVNRLFIIVLLIAGSIVNVAQTPHFQSYQLIRRKDPVQINAILQDRKGFIWLGTTEGLFRFDGKNYLRFTVNDSLPDNHVTCLAEDSTGRIWLGHRNGKISFREGEIFKKFDPEEGTSSAPISEILFDRSGNLWFGTLNDGLYYFTPSQRLYRLDDQNGMPDLYIYDLAEDGDGNILAGTDGGIAVCTLKKNKANVRTINYKNGLPDNIIRKIIPQEKGIWLATEDAGVGFFNDETGEYKSLVNDWSFGPVSDFIIQNEHLWIACPEKGLVIANNKTHSINLVDNHQGNIVTSVNVMLHDREGNFWLGGKTGLFRTPGLIIQYFGHEPGKDNNVLAVTEGSNGDIWYSTGEGLFRMPRYDGMHPAMPLAKTPYERFTVISLHTDPFGYVWAGLYGEGVLRIDPVTNKIRYIQKEINNGNVLNITSTKNKVWLATLGGVCEINIDGDKLTFNNIGTDQGLISDFIYQVFVDSKDRVWFATDGKGVDMLDKNGFHHYESGLPSKIVYSVVEDGVGNIWVNVQGSGLYRLVDNNFKQVGSEIAPRESEIAAVAADGNGNVVVMHNAGLDVINVAEKKVRYLGDDAGLREKIPNLNAVSKNAAGDLFFGSSSGIVKYSTSAGYFDHRPIPIVSTVKIYDKPFNPEGIKELSYDQDNLTFEFLGLWYQNPDNVYYSFMLENYDRDWILTKNSYVTYSQLPPGSYTFKVRASASGSFGDAQVASIPFMVRPPFWRTPPFYMLLAGSIIICGYLFMRFRERRLMHEKIVLEAKVRRRTMEVQRQNDEIQAQNEEIMAQAEEIKGINENLESIVNARTAELERKNKALEEYAFINAHKLRSPVASILGLVHLISKTNLDDEGKEITKRLRQSANELDDIVRSITKAIEQGEQDTLSEKHRR